MRGIYFFKWREKLFVGYSEEENVQLLFWLRNMEWRNGEKELRVSRERRRIGIVVVVVVAVVLVDSGAEVGN